MLQLSPTLSLGDRANAIVLPLRVYPFPFCHLCLPPFPPCPKAPSHPSVSLYLPRTPLLTLGEFFSPPADEMLHRFSLCGDEMGGRRQGEGDERGEGGKKEREERGGGRGGQSH